jgi:hypothetical protein
LTAETRAIEVKARVDKGTFIKTFVEELSGDNERRRQLALQAIVVVMPEDAPRFLEIIAAFDPRRAAGLEENGAPASPKEHDAIRNAKRDAKTAQDLLNINRAAIVEDMFADSRDTRVSALSTLRKNYSNDPALFDVLVARGQQEIRERAALPDDQKSKATAGLYNTVSFFGVARVPADAELKTRIRDYLVKLQQNGSADTKSLAASTVKRFE